MALLAKKRTSAVGKGLPKARTGIEGLDQITNGGLPAGRPTLICGSAGAGKTMLAMEFLLRGAIEFGEPGVCMSFEETAEDLAANVASLGFDLLKLQQQQKIVVDFVRIERSEIEETGEYDLEGLFIRLEHAVNSIGAKRVVLDTLEALFAGLPNEGILRAELRRLFRWLKDRGLTAMITGERGDKTLSRFGLEEYIADCVIVLDHRIDDQSSTRRLRVVKYRGSAHGTNEYPFLIGSQGISVLPVTSLRLDHDSSTKRVGTGIAALDQMLEGKGVFLGSSVLISGSAGTGKSSIGCVFADAACRRGERALIFAYEESEQQILRNMRSIGIDLAPWIAKGLLCIHATRPTMHGLEQHLVLMHDLVKSFNPALVVVDPISNLSTDRDGSAMQLALMRLVDALKQRQITALFTTLVADTAENLAVSQSGLSSLMDTWLLMSNLERNGERTRTLQVVKSRGMAHSNRVREFVMSSAGVDLIDVYVDQGEVLTGIAREACQARLQRAADLLRKEQAQRQRRLQGKRDAIEAQIAALQADLAEADTDTSDDLAVKREVLHDPMDSQIPRGGRSAAPRKRRSR